jgi:hypothetical protein
MPQTERHLLKHHSHLALVAEVVAVTVMAVLAAAALETQDAVAVALMLEVATPKAAMFP